MILTGFVMAQWVTVAPKPPVEMKQFNIDMNYWHEQVYGDTLRPALDEFEVAIPDSFVWAGVIVAIPDSFAITYDVNYRIYMYDEDGKSVGNNITQGDLQQYLTPAEKTGLKGILDKYGAQAIGLLP